MGEQLTGLMGGYPGGISNARYSNGKSFTTRIDDRTRRTRGIQRLPERYEIMAYSKVLNRPMFNKHNSAYGRGIASNLVSDEQRQRFNYGGRVGYAQKGYVPVQTQVAYEDIEDLYTPKYFEEQFEEEFIPKLQRKTEQFNPYTQSKTDPLEKDPMQFMFSPYISKEDWAISERVKDDKSKKDYYEKEWLPKQKKKYQKRIDKQKKLLAAAGETERLKEFDDPVKEELEDLNLRPEKTTQTTDKYSDLLDWSPQEKQEKIGQMQLAMAERLIGGSRDKWGSTAQMKNLAGALGDVRKITDKEDIRKDQRKYRAYAEMPKKISLEEHKLATG